MSWESIIGFIVIAAISSLFNKNKRSQQNNRNPRPTATPVGQGSPLPKSAPARPERERSRRPGSLMDEVLKELQRGMTEEMVKEPPADQIMEAEIEESPPIEEYEKEDVKLVEPATGQQQPIYQQAKVLNFGQKEVLQGIIMSEILGKPKALR